MNFALVGFLGSLHDQAAQRQPDHPSGEAQHWDRTGQDRQQAGESTGRDTEYEEHCPQLVQPKTALYENEGAAAPYSLN